MTEEQPGPPAVPRRNLPNPLLRDVRDLLAATGAGSLPDLAELTDANAEYDMGLEYDGEFETLMVRCGQGGIELQFPFRLSEFREAVDDADTEDCFSGRGAPASNDRR